MYRVRRLVVLQERLEVPFALAFQVCDLVHFALVVCFDELNQSTEATANAHHQIGPLYNFSLELPGSKQVVVLGYPGNRDLNIHRVDDFRKQFISEVADERLVPANRFWPSFHMEISGFLARFPFQLLYNQELLFEKHLSLIKFVLTLI